ncbi:MAG: hypothetical protein K0A94_11930 [Desulfuromonadales bacterium]|nr:hypothetical protein [Desulfuromonadales bacterium]
MTTVDASGAGVAPPQEINSSEAQSMLIIRIAIRNMARNLADAFARINCFDQNFSLKAKMVTHQLFCRLTPS